MSDAALLSSKVGFFAAALLLLGSLVAVVWLANGDIVLQGDLFADPSPETASADGPLTTEGPGAADAVAAVPESSEDGPERVAVPDSRVADPAQPARESGRVIFRPFDAITGQPPPGVSVRYLSDDRFADRGQVEGTVEALLTAGTYRASLAAPGYEPRELEPFAIEAEHTLDLGYVAMNRGLGTISGRVLAPSLPQGTEITVELRGRGRHPCQKAEADRQRVADPDSPGAVSPWNQDEPCKYCGFARDASRFRLVSGDPFEFGCLASGPYLLRAFIQGPDPVDVSKELTLSPAGRLFEELLLSRTVQMTVDLRDPDGNPVTGLFETEEGTVGHAVRFLYLEGSRTRAEARVGGSFHVLQGGAAAPLLRVIPFINLRRTDWVWNNIQFSDEVADQIFTADGQAVEPPLDRPRAEDDTLFARPSPLHQEQQALPARMQEPGRYVVDAVPAEQTDLVVRCGPLMSDRISLDLRAYDGRVIFLEMRETDEPPEEEEPEGTFLLAQELLILSHTAHGTGDFSDSTGVSRFRITFGAEPQTSDEDGK
ncbi:MAG: hypothetical protein V2A76_12045 [Planctomycetota bacterium]